MRSCSRRKTSSSAYQAYGIVAALIAEESTVGRVLGLLDVGWEAPAPVLAGCLVALGLFGQAFWRLRQRGRTDHAGWDRAALFVLALALTFLALASRRAIRSARG